MWEHVIKCCKVRTLQWEFIKETTSELIKCTSENVNVETVLEMIEDIAKFFGRIELEYETS